MFPVGVHSGAGSSWFLLWVVCSPHLLVVLTVAVLGISRLHAGKMGAVSSFLKKRKIKEKMSALLDSATS